MLEFSFFNQNLLSLFDISNVFHDKIELFTLFDTFLFQY